MEPKKQAYFVKSIKIYLIIMILILSFFLYLNASTFNRGDKVYKLDSENQATLGIVQAKSLFGRNYVVKWQTNTIEEMNSNEVYSIDNLNNEKIKNIIKDKNKTNYLPQIIEEAEFENLASKIENKNILNKIFNTFEPKKKECVSEYVCNTWSSCKPNYKMNNLLINKNNITGIQTKICLDKNFCAPKKIKTQNCELSIPITAHLSKEKQNTINIYKKDSYEKLSEISIKHSKDTKQDIVDLKFYSSNKTHTCYNKKKDKNELDVDCGGPCQPCYKKYQVNQKSLGIDILIATILLIIIFILFTKEKILKKFI